MALLYESNPARRFEVALAPSDAVRFVIGQWSPRGFTLEDLDLHAALAERGEWTGVVMRGGSMVRGRLADFLVDATEVLPLLIVLAPWAFRQHGRVLVAVIARSLPGAPGHAELICWNLSRSGDATFGDSAGFVIDRMEALTQPLRSAGMLLAGPYKPTSWRSWKHLPQDHPLQPRQWRSIQKAARRYARRRRA